MNYERLVSKCDGLIKAGRVSDVAAEITALNVKRVPRRHRQALAKICRRSGLIKPGLRLLQPVVRHERELEQRPTPGEICEYAVLLSRNGSVQEALDLLGGVDASATPEALLYQGFCHVMFWNYAEAAIFFERFLSSGPDAYTRLIARVNLGAAYVALSDLERAKSSLSETLELAEAMQATRLMGNLLELRGQAHVLSNDFGNAGRDLDRALSIFGETRSYDQLLILKWRAVMEAEARRSAAPLERFRAEALQRKHWESVREADLFVLKLEFSQELFDRLIIGTPSESYRSRIRSRIGREPGASFVFGSDERSILDLASGRIESSIGIDPCRKVHQTIAALTRDLYAPRGIGAIWADLYPGEYFDVDSSPLRIRQNLTRLRRWSREHRLALHVEQSDDGYRLRAGTGFGVRLPLERGPFGTNDLRWQRLLTIFPPGAGFEAESARFALGLSRSGFHRFAEWAIAARGLERHGIGKATHYRTPVARRRSA